MTDATRTDELLPVVREIVGARKALPGALLPILHAIQERFGWVPDAAVPVIAAGLNLSRAEVHGVLTFYRHFRRTPPGRHVVQLCRAESCQAQGAVGLEAHVKARLGIDFHQTTSDGVVTLEPVYCLGNCACSPAIRVDDAILGHVDHAHFDAVLAALRAAPPDSGRTRPAGASPAAEADRRSAVTVFVPIDSGALSVGADAVAQAIESEAARRGIAVKLIRNGSRGLYWLEPLVEVETPAGRVGYGPVATDDVRSLFESGFLGDSPAPHALAQGAIEAIPFIAHQERLSFARVGLTDPLSIADYRAHGGFAGLARALAIGPAATLAEVADSGLRGRGGAAFPTGLKWKTVSETAAPQKYVVCNADEGDSGTFADRMLIEGDPYALIEGMAIAGLAVGATQGTIYLRSEYPHAFRTLLAAIPRARAAGLLGPDLLGSRQTFELDVRLGAGAYICGEETALLESLEGRRGVVRAKPPLPAVAGLFGSPTAVNNVVTLATVPTILARGGAFYRDFGAGRSRGTLPFQLAGNLRRTGLVEKAFGLTLRELLYDYGGGSASGRPLRAVQVGGPLGAWLPPAQFDVPLDYETYAGIGAMIGHGGIVAFDDTVDLAAMARYAMAFCAEESCGKCTPCRIGSTRGVEIIDRILEGTEREKNLALLESLCDTMLDGSLCALGGLTPYPVRSALRHFPEDFERRDRPDKVRTA